MKIILLITFNTNIFDCIYFKLNILLYYYCYIKHITSASFKEFVLWL